MDEKLVWDNITDFAHIKKMRIPCDLVWLPDIVLYNRFTIHFCSRCILYGLIFLRVKAELSYPLIEDFVSIQLVIIFFL